MELPSSVPIARLTLKESFSTSFENSFDLFFAFVDSADLPHSCVLAIGCEHKHALGFAQYGYVGIVSDKDHLATPFDSAQGGHDRVVDERVVKVVLGLVNQQRALALS
jgi:hypothetical protein